MYFNAWRLRLRVNFISYPKYQQKNIYSSISFNSHSLWASNCGIVEITQLMELFFNDFFSLTHSLGLFKHYFSSHKEGFSLSFFLISVYTIIPEIYFLFSCRLLMMIHSDFFLVLTLSLFISLVHFWLHVVRDFFFLTKSRVECE